MQPSSWGGLARPRGEAVLSRDVREMRTTSRFLEDGGNEQRNTTQAFCEPTRTVRGKPTEKRGKSR